MGFRIWLFPKQIDKASADLDAYNTLLSRVDEAYNTFAESERALSKFSIKMLLDVAIRYGKDSSEYEMAGGVSARDRERSTRKKAVSQEIATA